MDTKRMLLGMLTITAVMVVWQMMYALHPEWQRPGDDTAATQPATTQMAQGGASTIASTMTAGVEVVPSTRAAGPWQIAPTTAPAVVTLGSATFGDTNYHMGLQINSTGAGLDWVALNQFKEQVDSSNIFEFEKPYEGVDGNTSALATVAAVVDGQRIDLAKSVWTSDGDSSASHASFFLDLAEASGGAVRIHKTFQLAGASEDSQGYELAVRYSAENRAKDSHTVSIESNGPTVPHAETSRQDTEIVGGYNNDGMLVVENKDAGSFKDAVVHDYTVNGKNYPMLWVGASSNYFNALIRPEDKAIAKAGVLALNPTDSGPRLVSITVTSNIMTLAPGQSAAFGLQAFFGPKTRQLLNTKYYSSFPLGYDQTLVLIGGGFFNICGCVTWTWLINLLVMLLAGFHFLLRDWGLAIIALVCCVRLLLHPITKKSQVSMMKMQKLAPEIERLKVKYGDDKDGFARAQMDVYKSVGFTPVLGCLPMFLQMPIFIALWRALQTTFELRQAPFLEFFNTHFTWIHDLSQPDQLVKFSSPVTFLFFTISAINILPLAMAVVTFINQKYFVPKPAAMTPEQEQQQKMMTYMTLIFPFMFYSFPSGLNLYYLTSTSLGIIESKRIRNHIKQQQEIEEREGPERVGTGKRSRTARKDAESKAPTKQGWLAKKVADFQARAEAAIIEAQKKGKDGKKG